MKNFMKQAAMAAALATAFASGSTLSARAGATDYEFQLVSKELKVGAAEIAVRLVHKPDGKPVPDAVIFATRLDMSPDGMEDMATALTPVARRGTGGLPVQGQAVHGGRLGAFPWRQGAGRARDGARQADPESAMNRLTVFLLLATALVAGSSGYWAGRDGATQSLGARAGPAAAPSGPVIYYRDPDRKPFYSATPKKTADGRDYVAVLASEDVSFEPKANSSAASAGGPKRVRYYRNPMGLPDTSPVPKKDSMGMDYIPVYEGEDEDGPTVKISPGKLQRTGVRSEPVTRRVLTAPIRAPGVVEPDEHRQTVVALRFDAFIEKLEHVTHGSFVRKGQPLMRLYSSALSAAAAQYLTDLGIRDTALAERPRRQAAA